MLQHDTSIEALLKGAMPHAITDHETQCALVRQAQAGDDTAKSRLILGSVGLVVRLVQPYRTAAFELGLETSDLVTVGLYGLPGDRRTGLIRAIEKFDPDRGYRLSTYARYWVADASQQLLRRSELVRGPLRSRWRALRTEIQESTLVSEPTDNDPADSIDTAAGLKAMRAALPLLNEQQRKVIELRYSRREMPIQDVAKALGVSRQRVQAIELAAIAALRELMGAEAPEAA